MGRKCRKKNENYTKTVNSVLQFWWQHGLPNCFSSKACMFSLFFFVWTCYSHTDAYMLGPLWTRIDAYWQNFVVLVAICGHKVNLYFAKRCTKNKDFNSVWQQKVAWMHGINAVTPSNIVPPEKTARIPFT